jgi:ADP-ribose pyrophosphatase YjhB (NUDIX family)
MMGPGPGSMVDYQPRAPIGVVELNIGDQWRAKWVDADELPEEAPVFYAYAVVYRGDKGYLTRPRGSDETWRAVEGPLEPGETVEDFIRRASMEMVGATVDRSELVGFLECKPTKFNQEFPKGAITVRPVYMVVASAIDDVPDDSGFERRRMPLNEHSRALRARYPEIDEYLNKVMQRYAVLQATGAV